MANMEGACARRLHERGGRMEKRKLHAVLCGTTSPTCVFISHFPFSFIPFPTCPTHPCLFFPFESHLINFFAPLRLGLFSSLLFFFASDSTKERSSHAPASFFFFQVLMFAAQHVCSYLTMPVSAFLKYGTVLFFFFSFWKCVYVCVFLLFVCKTKVPRRRRQKSNRASPRFSRLLFLFFFFGDEGMRHVRVGSIKRKEGHMNSS